MSVTNIFSKKNFAVFFMVTFSIMSSGSYSLTRSNPQCSQIFESKTKVFYKHKVHFTAADLKEIEHILHDEELALKTLHELDAHIDDDVCFFMTIL